MKSEAYIQNEIRCELSKHGIVIRQNTGNFKTTDGRYIKCGVKGLSDLLFIGKNGKVAFLEVKTATGRASKEQLNFIDKVQRLGHKAGIVRSVDEALKMIGG